MSYFLFVPLRSFFLCYPGESLTGVSNKLSNIDSNNGILISRNTIYIQVDNVVKQSETQHINKTDLIYGILGLDPSSGKNKLDF